nr:unnamed protein product [Spirometra erinaceieuropaei]
MPLQPLTSLTISTNTFANFPPPLRHEEGVSSARMEAHLMTLQPGVHVKFVLHFKPPVALADLRVKAELHSSSGAAVGGSNASSRIQDMWLLLGKGFVPLAEEDQDSIQTEGKEAQIHCGPMYNRGLIYEQYAVVPRTADHLTLHLVVTADTEALVVVDIHIGSQLFQRQFKLKNASDTALRAVPLFLSSMRWPNRPQGILKTGGNSYPSVGQHVTAFLASASAAEGAENQTKNFHMSSLPSMPDDSEGDVVIFLSSQPLMQIIDHHEGQNCSQFLQNEMQFAKHLGMRGLPGAIPRMGFLVNEDEIVYCTVLRRAFLAPTYVRECFRARTDSPRKWQVIDTAVAYIGAYIKTSGKFLGVGQQGGDFLASDASRGHWYHLGKYYYTHYANNISRLDDRILAFTLSGEEDVVDGHCKHLDKNWSGNLKKCQHSALLKWNSTPILRHYIT